MTIRFISAKNPKWADPTGLRIDLDVDFEGIDEEFVPYTAYKDDSCEGSKSVFQRAESGEFGDVAPYTPPADVTGDEALEMLRNQRDELLVETDYIEIPSKWNRLSSADQEAWTTYRNALRDLPQTSEDVVYRVEQEVDGSNYITRFVCSVDMPVKPE